MIYDIYLYILQFTHRYYTFDRFLGIHLPLSEPSEDMAVASVSKASGALDRNEAEGREKHRSVHLAGPRRTKRTKRTKFQGWLGVDMEVYEVSSSENGGTSKWVGDKSH